jgi:hypothetical protein
LPSMITAPALFAPSKPRASRATNLKRIVIFLLVRIG